MGTGNIFCWRGCYYTTTLKDLVVCISSCKTRGFGFESHLGQKFGDEQDICSVFRQRKVNVLFYEVKLKLPWYSFHLLSIFFF